MRGMHVTCPWLRNKTGLCGHVLCTIPLPVVAKITGMQVTALPLGVLESSWVIRRYRAVHVNVLQHAYAGEAVSYIAILEVVFHYTIPSQGRHQLQHCSCLILDVLWHGVRFHKHVLHILALNHLIAAAWSILCKCVVLRSLTVPSSLTQA